MKTTPPYLAAFNFGTSPVPLPSNDYTLFCDGATAQGQLAKALPLVANAQLVDIIHSPITSLPPGVGPFPVSLYGPTDGSTTSIYVLYGTITEQDGTIGTISEYAGTLADNATPPFGALERELGGLNSQTPAGAATQLALYISPFDPQDPELFSKLGAQGGTAPSVNHVAVAAHAMKAAGLSTPPKTKRIRLHFKAA